VTPFGSVHAQDEGVPRYNRRGYIACSVFRKRHKRANLVPLLPIVKYSGLVKVRGLRMKKELYTRKIKV